MQICPCNKNLFLKKGMCSMIAWFAKALHVLRIETSFLTTIGGIDGKRATSGAHNVGLFIGPYAEKNPPALGWVSSKSIIIVKQGPPHVLFCTNYVAGLVHRQTYCWNWAEGNLCSPFVRSTKTGSYLSAVVGLVGKGKDWMANAQGSLCCRSSQVTSRCKCICRQIKDAQWPSTSYTWSNP